MIHVSSENAQRYDRVKRKGVAFLSNLFKSKKLTLGTMINEDEDMEHASKAVAHVPGAMWNAWRPSRNENDSQVSRIPSKLSVAAVNVVVACQPSPSPSRSILTLTPGRTRNIDQDMEALKLSRQDNPFLQVLASRESLVESIAAESESDDAILMSQVQELGDTDPLTLAQVHEHLVRSPPPASWPHTTFHFCHQNWDSDVKSKVRTDLASPERTLYPRNDPELSQSEPSRDIRNCHSHTFSLLHPTPIRSLSDVRRLHRSEDDSEQLMSSE